MSEHDANRWIDAQLRDVPLPDGLIKRLRRTTEWTDGELDIVLSAIAIPDGLAPRLKQTIEDEILDERLRRVPVPERLSAGLKDIVAHERLDEQIRDVPVPEQLAGRLAGIVEDEQLDERVRRVPLPKAMLARVRQIPWRLRRVGLSRMAQAASLMLMIGGSYFLAMTGLIISAYYQPKPLESRVIQGVQILASTADAEIEFEAVPVGEIVQNGPAASRLDVDGGPIELLDQLEDYRAGPLQEILELFASDVRLTDDVLLLRYQILGESHRAADFLPELVTVAMPAARGVEAPMVPGYDRKFLVSKQTHPVVSLAGEEDDQTMLRALQTTTVPLWTDTTSYRLTQRMVLGGQLPRPGDIHVEDFLAAVDYRFPAAAPGTLELRTAGGPSTFGQDDARLLQVGVTAGDSPWRAQAATHLTVAVDRSASVRWGERLDRVRRALRRLIGELGPRDRISLVAFGEDAYILAEEAGPNEAEQLIAAVQSLRPHGATNVGAGLLTASAVAQRTPREPGVAHRLVLISDAVSGLSATEEERICQLLSEVAYGGVEVSVVDLSRQERGDPTLAKFAFAGRGHVVLTSAADRIYWALRETITGTSSVVAKDAVLRVTFNPEAVAAYRLFGHEATTLGGLMPVAVETDLRAGQSATALYEVWLKPNSVNQVARAELQWRDPASGRMQQQTQDISRLQFATSFAGSPLPLQMATLAAETAEVLRQSPFVGSKTRDLSKVLELSEEVNEGLWERPAFKAWLALVKQAQRARTRGKGGRSP